MKENVFKWSCKKVYLGDISIRKRRNFQTKTEEEYAVLKVTVSDSFDTFQLARGSKKTPKVYTLMCFREEIYKRLIAEYRFSFKGFVSLSYGNTYIVVTKAYDELGFDVEQEGSICFDDYSPTKR